MLWTLAVVLFLGWGGALFTGHTAGGLVHALLGAAVVVALVRVIQGRRTVLARRRSVER